jgi:hypothetical protein
MEGPLLRLFISFRSVNKHGCYRQFWFMVGRCLKSCLPRLLGQMNWNLVGNICGRSSIKIAHFVRSVNKYGHHRQILSLVDQFLKSILLWNRWAKWTKFGRNYLWKVFYKDCSFCPDLLTNMTAILVGQFLKIFSSETIWPNKAKFYRCYLMEGPL